MSSDQSTEQEAWFEAAKSGDVDVLKSAIESGCDVNSVDEKKNTALHHATSKAHLDAMSLLIENGAGLDLANDKLSTPLHLTEKNMDAIRILLEAGADPNLQDADYDYPYYFAFYGSMTRELMKLYIKHGANLMLYGDDE